MAGYVPRSMLDEYGTLIRGITDGTQQVMARQLGVLGTGNPDALKAAVRNTLAGADRATSDIDRQFYQAARNAAVGSPGTTPVSTRRAFTDGYIDRAVDNMYREHGERDGSGRWRVTNQEAFESDLSQFVGRLVNEMSKRHVEDYGSRDSIRPRYARVPSGSETCAYCYALAGLGFQYKSEETARAHGHADCDCVIVPSWNGSGVEGYNPRRYAAMFNNAQMDLREGNVSRDLRERVYSRAQTESGYDLNWKGTLAAMREIYDLK